ncbi:hypothetical protein ABIB60_002316 [Hymenobacter sp. UYP22]
MQKAQQLQRPVFVYAYSPGCHFCQQMEKTTLRNAALATYYNTAFVSVKVDVTVDTAFARRYDINGFPTYLYFDSAGQPLHRSSGEKPAAAFIADAQAAFQPQTAFYALQRQYQAGNRSPDLLYRYSQALNSSNQRRNPQAQVLTEYLATQSALQLKSEKNIRYLFEQYSAPTDEYIIRHQADFAPYFPAAVVQKRAYRILAARAFDAGKQTSGEAFRTVQELAHTQFADTAQAGHTARINFWEGRRDWLRYAQATRRYSLLASPDPYTLRKSATYLYHFGEEQGPERQQQALQEILAVLPVLLQAERSYESLLLCARLEHQAHRLAPARQLAEEALAIAPQHHETGEEAQTLLAALPAR